MLIKFLKFSLSLTLSTKHTVSLQFNKEFCKLRISQKHRLRSVIITIGGVIYKTISVSRRNIPHGRQCPVLDLCSMEHRTRCRIDPDSTPEKKLRQVQEINLNS